MTRAELLTRGDDTIADANFVRRNIITLAYRHKRWNIVVFESFRVVELLVKGIACITGHEPRRTHSLERIIDNLVQILGRQRTSAGLFVSLVTPGKNRYGVQLTSKILLVLKEIHGSWTLMGSIPHRLPADEIVRMTLSMQDFTVTVSVGGKILFQSTDASLTPPFSLHRDIVRAPRSAAIATLKSLSRSLLSTREDAFFATRQFAQRDARIAIAKMNLALGAAKSFYIEKH